MLKWNLVTNDEAIGSVYFESPLDSLESLAYEIRKTGLKTPACGAFLAVEYDPQNQFDTRGINTTRAVMIDRNGGIMLEYMEIPGVLVTNPPLTKDLKQ